MLTKVEIVPRKSDSEPGVTERYLQISVEDTGIGIAEEDKEKLFKLFGFSQGLQGSNSKGIGIGLVIAKKIVQEFEGDIKVES